MRPYSISVCRICCYCKSGIVITVRAIPLYHGSTREKVYAGRNEKTGGEGEHHSCLWKVPTDHVQHGEETDALETRHAERELALKEAQQEEEKEMAENNVTALKYVSRRLSILGHAATEAERQRLVEEQDAMNRLHRKQSQELSNLHRINSRQKLDLERKQRTELEKVQPRFQAKFVSRSAPRYPRLKHDMSELAIFLHERRSRLLARWFNQLQKLKAETPSLSCVDAPLPLSILTLPNEFMAY
jgi:ADP-ribose pyrophosphatase YjhB (NUDIX family)